MFTALHVALSYERQPPVLRQFEELTVPLTTQVPAGQPMLGDALGW